MEASNDVVSNKVHQNKTSDSDEDDDYSAGISRSDSLMSLSEKIVIDLANNVENFRNSFLLFTTKSINMNESVTLSLILIYHKTLHNVLKTLMFIMWLKEIVQGFDGRFKTINSH